MPAEYPLRFPIQADSPDPLNKIADAMRSAADKTKANAAVLQLWEKEVRLAMEEGLSLNRAITLTSAAFQKSGQDVGRYTIVLKDLIKEQERAERQADATRRAQERAFNRVETRVGAGLSGVPLPFGLQRALPTIAPGMGGAFLAGGAAVGVAGFAVDQITEAIKKAADYGREIQNLSAKTGLSNREAQIFSRTIEVTGGNVNGLVTQIKTLSKALSENSDEGRKAKQALAEIGLSPSVAFQGPASALSQIYGGIARAPEFSRERIATTLLGRSGVEALPYAGQFGDIQNQIHGLISDDDIKKAAEFKKNLTLIGIEFDNVIIRMGSSIIKYLGVEGGRPGESLLGKILNGAGVGLSIAGFDTLGGALQSAGRSQSQQAFDSYRQAQNKARLGSIETSYYAKRTREQNEADASYFVRNGESLPAGLKATLSAQRSEALSKIDDTPFDSSITAQERVLRTRLRQAQDEYRSAKDTADPKTGLPADDAVVRRSKARVDAIEREIEALKKKQQIDREVESFNERMTEKELDSVHRIFAERDALVKKGASPSSLIDSTLIGAGAAYYKEFQTVEKRSYELGLRGNRRTEALFGEEENKGLAEFDKSTQSDLQHLVRSGEEIRRINVQEQRDEILRRSNRAQAFNRFSGGRELSEPEQITATYRERISLAKELANVELESASKIGNLNDKRVAEAKALADYRKAAADADLEREQKLLDLQKKQYDQDEARFRSLTSGAASSLIAGGGRGFNSFLRGRLTGLASTVAGNLGGVVFEDVLGGKGTHLPASLVGTAQNPTFLGKLLKGTGFDASLSGTEKNVVAIEKNTGSLDRLTGMLERIAGSGGGSGGGSGIASAGGFSGGATPPFVGPSAQWIKDYLTPGFTPNYTSPGIGALYNLPQTQASTNTGLINWGSFSPPAYNEPGTGSLYNLPSTQYSLDPALVPGVGTGITGQSVTSDQKAAIARAVAAATPGDVRSTAGIAKGAIGAGSSLAKLLGANAKGIGEAAGIAAGGFTAFQGFSRGGGQGISEGISGLLGAAAAIPSPASPFLAAGSAVAGLVSAIFGDPKQNRANQINKRLEEYQFYNPTPLNVSASVGGFATAYNRQGQLVSTGNNPYPTIEEPYYNFKYHVQVPGRVTNTSGGAGPGTAPTQVTIQAMDASSFADFANQNADAIAGATVSSLQGSGGQGLIETLRPLLG